MSGIRENFLSFGRGLLSGHPKLACDFYLVEYPKSGVTWLSVLLANALLAEAKSNATATFSSVRNYIPDVHVSKSTIPTQFESPKIRLTKSHAFYRPDYIHVIYLVRHPLNVMRSYYKYASQHNLFSDSFDVFCFKSRFGIDAWKRHVNSWLKQAGSSDQRFLHLLRYEDLMESPQQSLRGLNDNFGWGICEESIDIAVQRSSLKEMQRQESIYRRYNPNHRMIFVSSQMELVVEDEIMRKIDDACRDEISLLGY